MKTVRTQPHPIRNLILTLSVLSGLSLAAMVYLALSHTNCNHNPIVCSLIRGFVLTSILVSYLLIYFLLKKQKRIRMQLKESEQKFFTISKMNPCPTFITFIDTAEFAHVNDAFVKFIGLNSEEIIGKTSVELEMTSAEQQKQIADETFSKGKVTNLEIKVKCKEGIKDIFLSSEMINIDNQKCFIGTMMNITEMKLTQKALETALNCEKEMNAMKSNFVSMASHEFRTPLAAISSSSSLLAKYKTTEQQTLRDKHLSRINSSVDSLVQILEELLSLDKIETKATSPSYTLFNIEETNKDIVRELKIAFSKTAEITYSHHGEKQIISDYTFLRHILVNLISNAVKYSGGEKPVLINSENKEGRLTMRIKDSGIGIPIEEQDKIFTRFFRAKNVADFSGTGLGLHIVKRYIDLLNGNISFNSDPGKGTEFIVELPVLNNYPLTSETTDSEGEL